jgi:hypothetical protein
MKNSLFLLLFAFTMQNCTDSESKKLEVAENEVMAIHDEIMPKMGEIMDLKASIAEKLKGLDSTAINYQTVKQELDSISYALTQADNGMMDWMDEYNADTLKAISTQEAAKYLEEQKMKVTEIKALTLKNIDAAKLILKK